MNYFFFGNWAKAVHKGKYHAPIRPYAVVRKKRSTTKWFKEPAFCKESLTELHPGLKLSFSWLTNTVIVGFDSASMLADFNPRRAMGRTSRSQTV
jgi:hypothetical protein